MLLRDCMLRPLPAAGPALLLFAAVPAAARGVGVVACAGSGAASCMSPYMETD